MLCWRPYLKPLLAYIAQAAILGKALSLPTSLGTGAIKKPGYRYFWYKTYSVPPD